MSSRKSVLHAANAKLTEAQRKAHITEAVQLSRRNFDVLAVQISKRNFESDQRHSYINGNYRPNLLADAVLCRNDTLISKHCLNTRFVTRFKFRLVTDPEFVHRISKQDFMVHCLEYLDTLAESDTSQLSSEQSLWVSALLLFIRQAIYLSEEDELLANRAHALRIVNLLTRSKNPGLKGKLLSDTCRLMQDLKDVVHVDNISFIVTDICWPIHKDLFFYILRCKNITRFLSCYSPEICTFYRLYLVDFGGKVHKNDVIL